MSTHGCFSPSFPPFLSTWLSQPDAGVQEPEIPRMILHGVRLRGVVRRSQAGGLAFSIVATFVLSFLRQTCLTYVCTQILLLPLTRLWSSTCIRALEAPGLYYDACMTYLCFPLTRAPGMSERHENVHAPCGHDYLRSHQISHFFDFFAIFSGWSKYFDRTVTAQKGISISDTNSRGEKLSIPEN